MRPLGPKPLSAAALKRFGKLQQKKYREEEGLFVAEGLRTVRELLLAMHEPAMLVALIFAPGHADDLDEAHQFADRCYEADAAAFSRLSATENSQGVIAILRQPRFPGLDRQLAAPGGRFVVALDGVQDPGNAGTILRTAAWFGADALLCGPGTVDLYNPKTVRSSAGSLFSQPHYRTDDLALELHRLRAEGFELLSSSLEGEELSLSADLPRRKVLVIGNEANGVTPEVQSLSDHLLRIPHKGPAPRVESLNAATSAAILIHYLSSKG